MCIPQNFLREIKLKKIGIWKVKLVHSQVPFFDSLAILIIYCLLLILYSHKEFYFSN